MGCGKSTLLHVYERDGVHEHRDLFEALAFKELDIGRLHKVYRKIDNDTSGEIELAELLAFLDLDRTRFTKRIFSIFDDDNSGLIDFKEFILSLWNYCTLTRASLTMFAFDLYDKDTSGSIDCSEVVDMLHDLYGREFKKNPQARLVERELEAMEALDGDVNIEDFREFSRTHPALLFNAFQMQEAIQERVLGRTFWEYYSERRIEVSKGRLYVPVTEFIELHINKKMMEAVKNKGFGLGDKLAEADVGYIPVQKFGGKITDKARLVLAATGTQARRKGKEVSKHDAPMKISRRQSTAHPASVGHLGSHGYGGGGNSSDGLTDTDHSSSWDDSGEHTPIGMMNAMDEQVRKEIKDKYGKDASFAMAAGLVPGLVSMGGPNKSERRASIAGKQPRRSFDNGNYSAGGHSKSQRRSFDGKDPNSTKKSTFQRDANDIGMDSAHPLPHSVRTALAQSHKENMSGRNTIAVGRRGSTKSQRRSFDGKIGP